MKKHEKNKSFALVLGLFVLCLITTCVIGSTLAKYTTGGSANDEARIAKWGVSLSVEADPLFENQYYTSSNKLVVDSSTNVVAPGTSSSKANGSAVFAISGTPEVATRIKIDMNNIQDVYLKAGTYADPTRTRGTFTLDEDYYPVVFILKQKNTNRGDVVLVSGTLSDIKIFLDAHYNNLGVDGTSDGLMDGHDYAPNTKLDATFELSWSWDFAVNDEADTYLGNLISGLNPDSLGSDKYNTTVKYELSITVEQVG